ncbi:hypothetical protein [Jannaschia sp. M317]|uniref:hypothetical protein n=1 Tax=Jannaschia sp. M317 TaxID=2867011 RepID=UPI0021A2767D|nr:hypothetical protein [Jannaschia sp. M317]UWQ18039.1 hypothetical protein K3551_01655 [Jannaschia sp. M317]
MFRSSFPVLTACFSPLLLLSAPVKADIDPVAPHQHFLPTAVIEAFGKLNLLPWVAGLFALGAVALLATHRLRLRRRTLRREIMGLKDGPRFRVVDAMAHATWRKGKIDPDRLKRAHEVARNTTKMDFDIDHIREVAHRADRVIFPGTFHYLGDNLNEAEKLVVFNAAVSVMLASGPLSPIDRSHLKTMASGLRLRRSDLRDLRKLIPA